jgi:glycine/serine hydroxymethyltransferase
MTRFGMGADEFIELAELIAAVLLKDAKVKDSVCRLRRRFLDMHYCFREADYVEVAAALRALL